MDSRLGNAETAQLEIDLLGPMQLQLQGRVVDLPSRKARALLAYLALRAGQSVPRETLTALLWGERGDDQARASLRQTLSSIRKSLGETVSEALIASTESVKLAPDRVHIDVMQLRKAADEGDVRQTRTSLWFLGTPCPSWHKAAATRQVRRCGSA